MTIRVNKSQFGLRETASKLDRPVGTAGNNLLGSSTPQEAGAVIGVGRKNLCINGNFKIWQRGTSVSANTGPNSGASYKYIMADRWETYFPNTYEKTTPTLPTGEIVNGLKETFYTNRLFFVHKIEEAGAFLPNKYITVSFWARTNGKHISCSLGPYWYNSWNGGQYQGMNRRQVTITDKWKYHTVTLSLTDNPQTRSHLAIEFDSSTTYASDAEGQSTASGDWWEFANIQIEEGRVATKFEHRTYAEELALCQRYYQTINDSDTFDPNSGPYGSTAYTGWQYSATDGSMRIPFQVTMRTPPTATIIGTATSSPGANGTIGAYGNAAWMGLSSITASETTKNSVRINAQGLSGSGKDAFGLYFYGTRFTSNITLSAEL